MSGGRKDDRSRAARRATDEIAEMEAEMAAMGIWPTDGPRPQAAGVPTGFPPVAPAAEGGTVSPDVAGCREMSPGVRSDANRRNKPNLLAHAAAGAADALTRSLLNAGPSATSVAALKPQVSPDVAACREVSPGVRSAVSWPNKPNPSDHPAASRAGVSRRTGSCRVVPPQGVRRVSPDVAACREMSPDVRSAVQLALRPGAGGLTEAQLAAVRLLLAGRRVTQVAAELQIATRTLLRWRKSPGFIAELRRRYEQTVQA